MRFIGWLIRVIMALSLMALLAGAGALWFGLIPPRYIPFAPLSLESPPGLFLDFQLAALGRDPAQCRAALKLPHIDAAPIPDIPMKDGCGMRNAVRFATAGGAQLSIERLTCETAAAATLWIEHEVQPAALALFGKRVTAIDDMGTYDCRNIVGNSYFKNTRSQHATANAIDIGGFTLEGGKRISVLKDWSGAGSEAKFLHKVHNEACHYFRVALSPNYNAAHKNHFHFDRGIGWVCR